MCAPLLPLAMLATAAVGAVGVGASIINGAKARKQQAAAAQQAEQQAAFTQAANERAVNQANQKSPNVAAIFGANRSAQGGGIGSTMLTGPGGVPAGSLNLDRHTLLGQ